MNTIKENEYYKAMFYEGRALLFCHYINIYKRIRNKKHLVIAP